MRRILMVFLVGAFLLGLAVPGFAENQGGTYTLDPFTGGFMFTGQHMDNSSYYGLRGGYNFTSHVAAEAMVGYIRTEAFDLYDQHVDELIVNGYRYGIDVLYHFNPNKRVVPFIAAGVGVLALDNQGGWANQSHGLLDYGVGLKWFISDTVALRGDARHLLYNEAGDTVGNLEFTVGLTFLIGAQKKAVARPGDTEAPEVVCTSPDSAVTGVAIRRNIVATFSEEMDRSTIDTSTFTLKRGTTPVSGRVTYTGTAATFNPSNDLEKGTIYTATIAAGVMDPAGNALAKSHEWSFATIPAPKIMPAVLISLEDAHFTHDSSALSENGKTILNYNARILKENPKMNIRVAGYASASGTQEYNQKLSEQRATVVKEYLIKEGGIDRERLTKIGYGETRPSEYEPVPSDIYSEAAKANQRVLFEVIVK